MILFQCTTCQRDLRALDSAQSRRVKCPCGGLVWVPGEPTGIWIGLVQPLLDRFGWKCPQCQQRIGVHDEKCGHCQAALPPLAELE